MRKCRRMRNIWQFSYMHWYARWFRWSCVVFSLLSFGPLCHLLFEEGVGTWQTSAQAVDMLEKMNVYDLCHGWHFGQKQAEYIWISNRKLVKTWILHFASTDCDCVMRKLCSDSSNGPNNLIRAQKGACICRPFPLVRYAKASTN